MNKDSVKSIGLFLLRAVAGIGIATHGFEKLFGGDMAGFARGVSGMGFVSPVFFAWAAALSEFVGGILMALGLKTRYAAGFVFVTMTVAVFVHHGHDAFHVRELALLYWAVAAAVALIGPGRFSLDHA